jgi:O-antigen ligase
MKSRSDLIYKVSFLTPLVVTLFVTPLTSFDPINTPRLASLIFFSSISIFVLLKYNVFKTEIKYTAIFLISGAFIIWSLISSLLSNITLEEAFYGVTGRQTGALAYFSFVIIMLVNVISSGHKLNSSLLVTLIVAGYINGTYGAFQSISADPFDWINPYSPVFGLFGNPNFHASFMGITATAVFSLLIKQQNKIKYRLIYGGFIPLALLNINQSKSQQGFLVLLAGVLVVLYLRLRSSSYKRLIFIYIAAWLIGALLVILDILQKTPWKSILYKESVSYRGDFWRAGWQITLDNPIFGVGLDGYRDNFRFYRDQVATDRNPNAMVDSAHNVFIDISSGGGFPLLIIYITILLLALISAVKVIKRSNTFDPIFAGIFGSWIAYLAQSLISINQIALAVWGWALTGAIIGYEIITRDEKQELVFKDKAIGWLAVSSGIVIGVAIALPLFLSDSQFRSTVKLGDVTQIQQSVERWPQSVIRMTLAAKILREGGFADQALEISTKATKLFPNNFEAWQELYVNPKASEDLKIEALQTMKKLDLLNLNLGYLF